MTFFRCKRCHEESPIRYPRSYIKSDAREKLEKCGWTVKVNGWRMEAICPECHTKDTDMED